MPASPLAGLRVLDCSRLLPAPYCSRLLADLGADVLRVDHPEVRRGDMVRVMPPHAPGEDSDDSRSLTFIGLNHGKRSVALDLTSADDQAHFLDLVERADVILESFRPGVLDRNGVGWDAIHRRNPAAILCSITGYGQTGPDAARAGHDIGYLARAADEAGAAADGGAIPPTINAVGPSGEPIPVPAPGIRFSRSPLAPGAPAPRTGADQAALDDLDALWPAR